MKRHLVFAICALFGLRAFACQETLLEYRLKDRITLLDREGQPLPGARIVVRETFGSVRRTRFGKSVGEVVRRGRTHRNGTFSLKGLKGESYWVTYNSSQDSESFFLIRDGETSGLLPLKVNGYIYANVCYTFDIEHNTTKPSGWRQPIATEKTH